MSKGKRSTTPAPSTDTLPQFRLDQLVIAWERPGHWTRTENPTTISITGRHLAALLGWLTRTEHPHDPAKILEHFGHPNTIALQLEALGELLTAVSSAEDIGEYAGPATWVLSAIIRDYANRLKAGDKYECDRFLQSAVVTVCDPEEQPA